MILSMHFYMYLSESVVDHFTIFIDRFYVIYNDSLGMDGGPQRSDGGLAALAFSAAAGTGFSGLTILYVIFK